MQSNKKKRKKKGKKVQGSEMNKAVIICRRQDNISRNPDRSLTNRIIK